MVYGIALTTLCQNNDWRSVTLLDPLVSHKSLVLVPSSFGGCHWVDRLISTIDQREYNSIVGIVSRSTPATSNVFYNHVFLVQKKVNTTPVPPLTNVGLSGSGSYPTLYPWLRKSVFLILAHCPIIRHGDLHMGV